MGCRAGKMTGSLDNGHSVAILTEWRECRELGAFVMEPCPAYRLNQRAGKCVPEDSVAYQPPKKPTLLEATRTDQQTVSVDLENRGGVLKAKWLWI